MQFFYIIITAAFAHSMENRQSPINSGHYFGYGVTTDSVYVISVNTINDFPQALDSFSKTLPGNTLSLLSLTSSNFPTTPPISR